MSQDHYQFDKERHGGVHIDRYNINGRHLGRYRLDGLPIRHRGQFPPPIPHSDWDKFQAEVKKRKLD